MSKKYGFDLLTQQTVDVVAGNLAAFRGGCPYGDSEIEKLLLAGLYAYHRYGPCEFDDFLIPRTVEIEANFLANIDRYFNSFILRPQAQVGDWRVDFLAHVYDLGLKAWRKLIVECDGHEFYERTKEQAAKDRSRDRGAIIDGITVLRFTGSELWRDPWGCAEQIYDWGRVNSYTERG